MTRQVLCTAPATSILIDTNKGVRPCCLIQGGFMGNLNEHKISDILSTERWVRLKQEMFASELPHDCRTCTATEKTVGTSLRHTYLENTTDDDVWNNRLTHLEFNGSNICNLACVHCQPLYSSRWHTERKKLEKIVEANDDIKRIALNFNPLSMTDPDLVKMHLPNPDLVIETIKDLDFSHLKLLNFRGGEPFLNSETTRILEYLNERDMLPGIDVLITTNCTYVDDDALPLLKKCRSVTLNLSIDGVYDLFEYIRYGDASFDQVEHVIEKLNKLPNVAMLVSVAPMNYNAFSLVDIRNWTVKMSNKYRLLKPLPGFNNCVIDPKYLSLRTLSDDTRKYLIDFYTKNTIDNEFQYVINLLSNEFIGQEIHNQWVEYTKLIESSRGNSIIKIVPELEKELNYVHESQRV